MGTEDLPGAGREPLEANRWEARGGEEGGLELINPYANPRGYAHRQGHEDTFELGRNRSQV